MQGAARAMRVVSRPRMESRHLGRLRFSAQQGRRSLNFDCRVDERFDETLQLVDLDSPVRDRFLTRHDAWGGGDHQIFLEPLLRRGS